MIRFFSLFLLLTAVINGADSAAIHSIAFRDVGNYIFLDVPINGKKLNFFFDTGCSGIVVDKRIPKAIFHLRDRQKSNIVGLKNRKKVKGFRGIVKIGDFKLGESDIIRTDLSGLSLYIGERIDGIIGYPLIKSRPVFVSHTKKRILVYSRLPALPRKHHEMKLMVTPYLLPYIRTYIYSRTNQLVYGDFILDSGSGFPIILNRPFCKTHRLYPHNRKLKFCIFGYDSIAEDNYMGRLNTLSIANTALSHVPTVFSDMRIGPFSHSAYGGYVGAPILKKWDILYDVPGQRVRFYETDRVIDFAVDCSGITMGVRYPRVVVLDVVKLSPAWRSGLRPGDRIRAVNGKFVNSDRIEYIKKILAVPGKQVALRVYRTTRNEGYKVFKFKLEALY